MILKTSTNTPIAIFLTIGLAFSANSQTQADESQPKWTEADRSYLLDNLIRSKEELILETSNLTEEQWNFKPQNNSWSINQIVEHIGLYELIFMNEISTAIQIGPIPNFKHFAPDSVFLDQDPEDLKKNKTTDFTKPFTHTVPLGKNDGINNLGWVRKMRSETIDFVKSDSRNLRAFYINFGPNIHQKCMMIFTHSNRHLRQIKRVKGHPDFPK